MRKRIITGVGIAILIIAVLLFSGVPGVLNSVVALLGSIGEIEILKTTNTYKNEKIKFAVILTALVVSFVPMPYYLHLISVILPVAMLMFGLKMKNLERFQYNNDAGAVIVSLVVIFLFRAISELRSIENGFYYLVSVVLVCTVTDVFAYFIGKAFGRHKLAPIISPKKTVEGSIGGIIFSILIVYTIAHIFDIVTTHYVNYGYLILWCTITSLVAQFSDLSMSVIKRITGTKDFGNVFPGHGGILDRFDSYLFAVPFTLLLTEFGVKFII